MNPRELNLRNLVADRAKVNREAFNVRIIPDGEGRYRVEVRVLQELDDAAMVRIDAALQPPDPPWHWRAIVWVLSTVTVWPFLISLGLFAVTALAFKSWLCLLFLISAWLFIPGKCPDCERYHL